MLLPILIAGGVTAYWFGLRPGVWAAAATGVLLLVAAFVPRFATPIHVSLAIALMLVCLMGSRQQRPPDVVRATRWVRATLAQMLSLSRSSTTRKRKDSDDQRR